MISSRGRSGARERRRRLFRINLVASMTPRRIKMKKYVTRFCVIAFVALIFLFFTENNRDYKNTTEVIKKKNYIFLRSSVFAGKRRGVFSYASPMSI